MSHVRIVPQPGAQPVVRPSCNIYDGDKSSPRRRNGSVSVNRTPSFLAGLKNFMSRPRSGSVGGTQAFYKRHAQRTFTRVQVDACQLDNVYDLREGDGETADFYDDELAFRRPRSNSSDFLILRKTSRPLSVDVVGLVDSQSDPYRQYMKVVDVYELGPTNSRIICIDKNVGIDKAFDVICENQIGAALVWDSDVNKVVALVTLTDFLGTLKSLDLMVLNYSADVERQIEKIEDVTTPVNEDTKVTENVKKDNNENVLERKNEQKKNKEEEKEKVEKKEEGEEANEQDRLEKLAARVMKPPSKVHSKPSATVPPPRIPCMKPVSTILPHQSLVKISADAKIFDACQEFCNRHVHRLLVTEPGTDDVLYLLTLKRILQAIHKQNRSLHFAQWLSCPIKESNVGTWTKNIITTTVTDTVDCAVTKMLENRISGLPLINEHGKVINVLVKYDVANAFRYTPIADHAELLKSPICDIMGYRKPFEILHQYEPVGKVLDALLGAPHVRSIFVVDRTLAPVGCISLSDVIRHLTMDESPFQRTSPQQDSPPK